MKSIRYRVVVTKLSDAEVLAFVALMYNERRKVIIHFPYIDVDVPMGQASQRGFERLCLQFVVTCSEIPKDFNI